MLSLSGMMAFLPQPLKRSLWWCRWEFGQCEWGQSQCCCSGCTFILRIHCLWSLLTFPSPYLPIRKLAPSSGPINAFFSLSCRGAAESAQTRRSGRDHLPQEWQWASERCLGLPTYTDCDQPLFQVSSEQGSSCLSLPILPQQLW